MNTMMSAGVISGIGRFEVVQRPVPLVTRPDAVLLEVKACGVCGSDLHILSDPPGIEATIGTVLGHEFTGVVREVGSDVSELKPGDRVVVAPNVACGQCVYCRRGLPNHCANFTTHGVFIDGGLAPFVVVGAASCFPIADHVPDHLAALAEPLSTVVAGAQKAEVFPGDTALVLGAGPVGLMFIALLRLAGARVIAVEPSPYRSEKATQMGADLVLDPRNQDVVAEVEKVTELGGADVVVDAVGSQLGAALRTVRVGGNIVLFGQNDQARTEVAQGMIVRKEIRLVGSFVGKDVFPTAIRLLEEGRVDFAPLVTHRIGLDQLPAALDELRAGRAVKVEVEFAHR